jgi:hypothetical protein
MNKKRIIIVAVVLIVGIAALSAAPWQGRAAATPMQGRAVAAPVQGRMVQSQAVQQRQMLQDCILEDGTLAEVPEELQELIAQRRAEAEQRQALNQANRGGYGRSNSQRPNRNW